MKDIVLKYTDDTDIYTDKKIRDTTGYQMDHIVECQMMTNSVDNIKKVGTDFKQKKSHLNCFLRENVVNSVKNLCFTEANINSAKGKAVQKAIKDNMDFSKKSFIDYLIGNDRKTQLDISVCERINKHLGDAVDNCIAVLEVEQPLHLELAEELAK
ncbi:hypothetical protein HDV01_001623, partial [Terramyces sp. JEL0728]